MAENKNYRDTLDEAADTLERIRITFNFVTDAMDQEIDQLEKDEQYCYFGARLRNYYDALYIIEERLIKLREDLTEKLNA